MLESAKYSGGGHGVPPLQYARVNLVIVNLNALNPYKFSAHRTVLLRAWKSARIKSL
jgi:hypothetical protein